MAAASLLSVPAPPLLHHSRHYHKSSPVIPVRASKTPKFLTPLVLSNPKPLLPIKASSTKISETRSPLLNESTRTITTVLSIYGICLKFALSRLPTTQSLLKPGLVRAARPLFFAALRDRPSGVLNTPLTVVAAGLSKWLDIYSGVLMVRVLLSWFPNIPWDRQPLSAIRDLCDPYLNLFRNIIPPLTLGVADGVGGWLKKGIDSGKYSRELLKNSVDALDRESRGSVNLRRVLEEAFCMTKSEGSSTACIITLRDDDHDHEHCLNALNVGDSGFMLFRNNKCKFKSSSQQHRFNKPYQLGNFNYGDGPDIATEIVVQVESGDVVVVGTDGLLDNMFPYEIEEILSRTQDDKNVGKLAKTIAKYASYNATDRYSDSPFSRAHKLAGTKPRLGGKIDDISVVVAKII
ncbi:hypothetical protein EZV62_014846 [Acer yangbiense]|uniref:Protein phosphatase n=1 Tax=Acer yangbiense TaxID=1000413 RepID=A0A5C7HT38_9ROSI|nr:hypothetical protein EZV62_014846 [Acer yangbiense]